MNCATSIFIIYSCHYIVERHTEFTEAIMAFAVGQLKNMF